MENDLEIYQLLMLSTAHLRQETFAMLDCDSYMPISYVNTGGFGTVVRITDDDVCDNNLPKDLLDCLSFAYQLNIDYIRFDPGVEPIDDLPTYAWE